MEPLSEEAIARLTRLGGPSFLHKMIDLFLEFGAGKVAEAREAFDRNDFAALGKTAHSLKSSAANVGALRVESLAAEIEQRTCAGGGGGLAESVGELEAAFQEVQPLLEVARGDSSAV